MTSGSLPASTTLALSSAPHRCRSGSPRRAIAPSARRERAAIRNSAGFWPWRFSSTAAAVAPTSAPDGSAFHQQFRLAETVGQPGIDAGPRIARRNRRAPPAGRAGTAPATSAAGSGSSQSPRPAPASHPWCRRRPAAHRSCRIGSDALPARRGPDWPSLLSSTARKYLPANRETSAGSSCASISSCGSLRGRLSASSAIERPPAQRGQSLRLVGVRARHIGHPTPRRREVDKVEEGAFLPRVRKGLAHRIVARRERIAARAMRHAFVDAVETGGPCPAGRRRGHADQQVLLADLMPALPILGHQFRLRPIEQRLQRGGRFGVRLLRQAAHAAPASTAARSRRGPTDRAVRTRPRRAPHGSRPTTRPNQIVEPLADPLVGNRRQLRAGNVARQPRPARELPEGLDPPLGLACRATRPTNAA